MKGYASVLILLLVVIGLTIAAPATALSAEGKIPITTSSDEALKLFLQGRDLYEKLRGQDAISYLEQATAKDPDFALAYLFLALAQPTNKGFFDTFDKAAALEDKVSDAEKTWIEGVQAGINADPLKQRKLYLKLTEEYPNDERAQNNLGNNYFGQQDWQLAIESYEKAIAIDPEFSQPYNQMGYALRFLGKYDDAEKAFQKYIELIPDDPNPYDSYAELLMKTGQFEKSIEYYQKALAVDSNFVASYIGMASDLNFLGKQAEARQKLQDLMRVARNDGERRAALFAMAVSYADEGKLEDALSEVKQQYALAEKIDDATAMGGDLVAMGNILIEEGNFDEAQAKFDQALEVVMSSGLSKQIKENFERGHFYNMARLDIAKGDLDGARSSAKEFTSRAEALKNPLQIKLSHELKGMIAFEEKDYPTAMAEFGQSNLQDPYNLYRVSLTYEANGDKVGAKKFCAKVVDFNALNTLNYSFVRNDAKQMLATMQ